MVCVGVGSRHGESSLYSTLLATWRAAPGSGAERSGVVSPDTHPVLRVFKHVGHTASVLLEASQQLSQADRQEPQSEPVKGHGGEFHGGSGLQVLQVCQLHVSLFILPTPSSCQHLRLSHTHTHTHTPARPEPLSRNHSLYKQL